MKTKNLEARIEKLKTLQTQFHEEGLFEMEHKARKTLENYQRELELWRQIELLQKARSTEPDFLSGSAYDPEPAE